MSLRLPAAILAGKIASWLSRLRGHKGSSLPGLVARKIYPGTLRDLAARVRKGIVVISGTNGKTTTSNMIADILAGAGYKVIANREGANLITGVTTSFLRSTGMRGRIDCDFAVLEVDEASMPVVLAEVTPRVVVLTNFFRDQLDRYWEVDKIVGTIRDSLRSHQHATLILNADDPLVAQFERTTGLASLFYGLGGNDGSAKTSTQTREAKFCPFCGTPLAYDYFHYGQLGAYHCPGCDFKRPAPRVEALEPRGMDRATSCRLFYEQREVPLKIRVQGLYNLYNALAAFTVGVHLGVDIPATLERLEQYRPVTGRMERFCFQGKDAFLSLVKNPTGFNEALGALLAAGGTRDVFIAINDHDADGRDVSWLWDVDFERLALDPGPLLRFTCSGTRGEEMALRLKYAGLPVEKLSVEPDLRLAINEALAGPAGTVYLFTTYTALWPVHSILTGLADKEEGR